MLLQKNLLLAACLIITFITHAQRDDCGTPSPKVRLYPDAARAQQMRTNVTYPIIIKVFVHVIANNNGSNIAAGDSSVLRQFENMRQFYQPQGICFILAGYEQINSTDLNTHNTDTEEGELSGFLVPDMVNVFVHSNLMDNDGGLNGSAYDIPNYYLSISRGAITSLTNRSTLAHEMGHDFGLYHTFESRIDDNGNTIRENVARSGNCKNCVTEGDLLCDTDADRNTDTSLINANSCTYTGNLTDACGAALLMTPTNIMTYGRRACRDNFTNGQGNRAENFILIIPYLNNAIAPDALLVNANQTINSGRYFLLARNTVSVSTSSGFSISGSAAANMSANVVTLNPGVTLSPSSGYTLIRANTLCQ